MSTSIVLAITDSQRSALSRVHAGWAKRNGGTVETMLYSEVFKSKATEYRHAIRKFEDEEGETLKAWVDWNGPNRRQADVRITPGDVDWDRMRAKSNPVHLGDGVTLRFPRTILDRLERGLALREHRSEQHDPQSPVKLYASFEEWAREQVNEYLQREMNRIEDEEAEKEEEGLYPELKREASTPAQAPARPKTTPDSFQRAGLNPHNPHAKKPWSR